MYSVPIPSFLIFCSKTTITVGGRGRGRTKKHEEVGYNMIKLCENGEESDLEDSKNDVTNQINIYQLHHQQIFLDDEDRMSNMILDLEHMNLKRLIESL